MLFHEHEIEMTNGLYQLSIILYEKYIHTSYINNLYKYGIFE